MSAVLSPRAVLVTGAGRGIGLAFVRHLLKLQTPPKHILAGCRSPDTAHELQKLKKTNPNIHLIKLDVTNYESYPDVIRSIETTLDGEGLNLLVHNAGINCLGETMEEATADNMRRVYEVNTIAPLMLTKALLYLLEKAAAHGDGVTQMSCSKAAIINVTSRSGSIVDNTSGGSPSYRCSKAAMNMLTATLAVDLAPRGILVISMHPGWVKTDMGGSGAFLTTDESVDGMLHMMAGFTSRDNGTFRAYDGRVLPW